MTEFTPAASFVGGILIGVSAVLLMALHGRIAGISGIVSRLLPPFEDGVGMWRAAFVVGLVAAPPILRLAGIDSGAHAASGTLALMAAAGLLVGFGAVLGSGCTSGHGVCGLSRFSVRSLAATLTFMATGAVTVFVVRHVWGG